MAALRFVSQPGSSDARARRDAARRRLRRQRRRRLPAGQVYAFDGATWTSLGCPIQMPEREDQIHALMVYRGKLHATTWPTGKVGAYDNGQWIDCGRLGDSTESNALVVYNGKLYAGTIPGAEVFRFEGEQSWTRLRRFSSPEVAEGAPLKNIRWGRVTSLTVHGGKLFAGIGGYTSALADAPARHARKGL